MLKDNPVFRYGVRRHWKSAFFVVPILMLLFLLLSFLVMLLVPTDPRVRGGVLVTCLGAILIAPAVLLNPVLAPMTLAREYENKTIEGLLLTLLTSHEIAAGKLASAVAPFLLGVAASLPFGVVAATVFPQTRGIVIAVYVIAILGTLDTAVFSLGMGAAMKSTLSSTFVACILGLMGLLTISCIGSGVRGVNGASVWGFFGAACVLIVLTSLIGWAMRARCAGVKSSL